MKYARIEVVIAGAVERAGRRGLPPGSTVESALRAAGGLARRDDAGPTGELVLRRRPPHERSVTVYRWNVFEDDWSAWTSFRLEQHDVLVFGWDVREDATRAG